MIFTNWRVDNIVEHCWSTNKMRCVSFLNCFDSQICIETWCWVDTYSWISTGDAVDKILVTILNVGDDNDKFTSKGDINIFVITDRYKKDDYGLWAIEKSSALSVKKKDLKKDGKPVKNGRSQVLKPYGLSN